MAKKPNDKEELYKAMYGLKVDSKKPKAHKFWNTQPVPQDEKDATDENQPIETKTVDQVRASPYKLPDAFKWVDCNIDDQTELDEVYKLLSANYVEDDDNMFRFDYSREFLKWALQPPGFLRQFHVGVRVKKSGKLVGFITGIPAEMHVYKKAVPMVEINFLCVHKKLRSKRLAPVLIKEITRRVNRTNVWQAVYTAGVVLPRPVARNRYYHRSLNPKKLINIGFSRLQPRMTMTRTIKLYSVPKQPKIPGVRELTKADVPEAHKLLVKYLKNFNLHQQFSEDEFAHWLLPRKDVINSFVVEKGGKITDLISFYTLPSHVIGNPKYKHLKAAYSFYNVAGSVSWQELMTDALVLAKQRDFDVFNALNVMENGEFLEKLKFGVGDGHLQYYVYNWRCKEMEPSDVGLVLL